MDTNTKWSTERIHEQFRTEIRSRFETENAAYRAEQDACHIQIKQERPERPEHCHCPKDSLTWETYQAAKILIDRRSVRVILAEGEVISTEVLQMFDGTSVAWSTAEVTAEAIAGSVHLVIRLLLIDYWDDDRAAEWERQHPRQSPLDRLLKGLGDEDESAIERVKLSPEMIATLLSEQPRE